MRIKGLIVIIVAAFIHTTKTMQMPEDNADDNTGTDLAGMKRLFNDTLSG